MDQLTARFVDLKKGEREKKKYLEMVLNKPHFQCKAGVLKVTAAIPPSVSGQEEAATESPVLPPALLMFALTPLGTSSGPAKLLPTFSPLLVPVEIQPCYRKPCLGLAYSHGREKGVGLEWADPNPKG